MKLPTITILALPDVDEKAHQKKRAVLVCTRKTFPLLLVPEHCFESERGEPGAFAILLPTCWRAWNLTFLFPGIKTTNQENTIPGEGYHRWL